MIRPNLRVHVAPVGYEVDRIVLPAQRRRADKVYLMVHDNPAQDRALDFAEKIEQKLAGMNIDLAICKHDRLDVFSIIRAVKEIIRTEDGNHIYVNLSSGSKIQAIGGMMACMMFNEKGNVTPFYVEAEKYTLQNTAISSGIRDIMDIPAYEIQKPSKKLIDALGILQKYGGKISKKKMAEACSRADLIVVNAEKKNLSQAIFASLDKNIIQPLRNYWRFIEEEKVGRTRWITITEEGRNAAKFLL